METTQHLETGLQRAITKHHARIGHNDSAFLKRIYGEGLTKYIDRLTAIGFAGHGHVLDAGCGFGQWSLALSFLNHWVTACDISATRVDVLRDLADNLAIANLDIKTNGIDMLPFPDASFDAVFCYGVIFLTPWRKSLRELSRVLKRGGSLYVNANGLGWYMFLWQEEHNKVDDYDPKAIAARAFTDTLRYDREDHYEPGVNLIIEPTQIQHELQQLGFTNVQIADEGRLHVDNAYAAPKPFLKGEYCGQRGIYEVLARKTGE